MAVVLRDELSAQLALASALVDCAFTASPPPQLWRDLHRLAGASYLDLLCLGVTYVDLAFCGWASRALSLEFGVYVVRGWGKGGRGIFTDN